MDISFKKRNPILFSFLWERENGIDMKTLTVNVYRKPLFPYIYFVFMLRSVLHEGLHCLIASQAEIIVQFCGATVAVFRALPEQALVVAKERSTLHL